MCGISGIVSAASREVGALRSVVRRMGFWQCHRGPDDWGEWVTEHVGLGHNRLAVLDVSGGKQPMTAAGERVAVVFNGEIYNYRELWRQLEAKGRRFYSDHSDTEVIVNGYLEWGEEVFSRLEGMFAIGIWDDRQHRLLLARDRVGIKPLYFAETSDGGLLFASEPKAILQSGLFEPRFRPEGLVEYFLFRAPYQDRTMFSGIFKLCAGRYRIFDLERGLQASQTFWQPAPAATFSSQRDAEECVEASLSNAVRRHLMADVPVGTFLSGGVDSSLVTALAARDVPLDAFTIGTDSPLDERPFAEQVAAHLRLPFHGREVSARDFLDRFDDWVYANDDPCSDPSALAVMLLAEQARQAGMKVVLAGEGGDELFGGYNSYLRFMFFSRLARVPFAGAASGLLSHLVHGRSGDYVRMLKDVHYLGTGHLTDCTTRASLVLPELRGALDEFEKTWPGAHDRGDALQNARLFDMRVRLPDDLLMRSDRATMFYGLEARVPLLDNSVIDAALRLSGRQCIRLFPRETKLLLKRLACRYVPRSVVYRPKRGFDLPLRDWLLTSFQPMLRSYLHERAVPGISYPFCEELLRQLVRADNARTAGTVWAWLVMERWYRAWVQKQVTARRPAFTANLPAYRFLAGTAGCDALGLSTPAIAV